MRYGLAVVAAVGLICLTLLTGYASSLPAPANFITPAKGAYVFRAGDPDAVEFTLLDDKVESDGRWTQTFRVHINAGGTLNDISELVYGDGRHIDELFAAFKRQHPNLTAPSRMPADIEAEISFDPSIAFVPRETTEHPDRGATVFSYYNGARRVIYDPKKAGDHIGLSAIVDLPADRPTKQFTVLEGETPVQVPAGVRLAYYEFQPGDDLKAVVAEIYGGDSTRAIQDFLARVNWNPNRWPPPVLEREQRLMIPLGASFADEPVNPLDITASNPVATGLLKAQLAERAKAGIYAIRRQPYGTVYHVVARDFEITARQVSVLLYGNDSEYLSIAAHAGFGTLHDLTLTQPQDVRLFGRTFDVVVDYERELFPARETLSDQEGKRTTILLNGTTINEFRLDQGKNGLLREVILPSGYRKLLYRPPTVTLLAGQISYALLTLGGGSRNPQVRQDEEGRFVSRMIWDHGPSVPRQPGEVLDYGRLVEAMTADGKTEQLMEVAVRPDNSGPVTEVPILRMVLGNPFLLGVAAVAGALVALGLFGWVARRA